jgi:hypothetical protein
MILVVLELFLLSLLFSCSPMISEDFFVGMEYRESPNVLIVEYKNQDRLQEVCEEIHRAHGESANMDFDGCSTVPYNPEEVCTIHIMEGDLATLDGHEMWHCHGYEDTWWPWKALDIKKEERDGQS